MKNRTKILWSSLIFCVVGLFIMLIGIFAGGSVGFHLDGEGIHSTGTSGKGAIYLEKTKLDSFTKAEIKIDYADFVIEPSDGYYLEYKVGKASSKPEYQVKDEKFIFEEDNNSKRNKYNLNFMSFSLGRGEGNYVKLYVPKDAYFEMISVRNSAGDLKANTLLADRVELSTEFGEVEIEALKCGEANIELSAGSVRVKQAEADSLVIETEFGDATVGDFKGKELTVELSAGEMKAGKIVAERFLAGNSFGDITIESLEGKVAEIMLSAGELTVDSMDVMNIKAENEFGDIRIKLRSSIHEYDLDVETEFGDIHADSYQKSGRGRITKQVNKGKSITIHSSAGEIKILEP